MSIKTLIASIIISASIFATALAETTIIGRTDDNGSTLIAIENPRLITDPVERMQDALMSDNISFIWVTSGASHRVLLIDDHTRPDEICKLAALNYGIDIYSVENARTTDKSYCSQVN